VCDCCFCVSLCVVQAVDNLLTEECDPLVEARRSEGQELLPRIGIFLQTQASHIQARGRAWSGGPMAVALLSCCRTLALLSWSQW
jgi:hypothetical protein